MGIRAGYRVLDLVCYRERQNKRETKFIEMLKVLAQNCWRYLFGHDGQLLKGQNADNEYLINDKDFIPDRYVSSTKDRQVTCGSFAAGIVEGILCSSDFPAEASAHPMDDGSTTILIKFAPHVLKRERKTA
eukprot:GHVL01010630.1.p1 GENE.GHVL01010630.1~~GHVL01010630.1.p1  ORF type:complete len:131 (+),score=19.28 GHVL01010630.1:230-622(+)